MRRAVIVVDLAFGDCGKGSIVDYLVRTTGSRTVVRYNGGPQAAHNVVTPDGRHHTFAQFGSGTFAGATTVLSRFVSIDPYAMANEAAHLQSLGLDDVWDWLTIDARCLVVTPVHQAANRLRERARGDAAHGTCGMGIGEAFEDSLAFPELSLRAADLHDAALVSRKLEQSAKLKREHLRRLFGSGSADAETLLDTRWIEVAVAQYADVARAARIASADQIRQTLAEDETLIFEGAQGILLDERFGFHPHTTWSTTTTANAKLCLDESGFVGERHQLGVVRPYMTRHGQGPMVTESNDLRSSLAEPHNADNGWPGPFRFGHFDAVAVRYGIAANGGIDALAVTCLDQLDRISRQICTAYKHGGSRLKNLRLPSSLDEQIQLTSMLRRCEPQWAVTAPSDVTGWVRAVESELNVPVEIRSTGPTAIDKKSIMRG